MELGQIAKEKEIAELLEETVVAKSGSVEDAEVSNEVVEVVAVNPVVTEVLEEPVPVGIDAIPVVKSVEVRCRCVVSRMMNLPTVRSTKRSDEQFLGP